MLPQQIKTLIERLGRLPSIGPRSAERLAFYMVKQPENKLQELAESIENLKKGLQYWQNCSNLSESDICKICQNMGRDKSLVCVVEDVLDVMAMESSGAFQGLYHVLHGAISPLDGIGPEQLSIEKLLERVRSGEIQELILATNPTVTGEATAAYIKRQIPPGSIKITHLAQGIPMGGHLEFIDPDTLKRAFMGRRES